ncbi:hypothetical protein SLU01_18960 [Sporosarcina luteola]|uniref:Nucleoid-associated protein n=1 Tax=Sporosarcina luteola TaxID=582850 RepID=A0A511Z842_9BACL|nr:nucleoid-associated protein [Sporosarcina luteola]GEN83584.1 hypothetical protein SLU01_18960 [Sporosarcina luteola]
MYSVFRSVEEIELIRITLHVVNNRDKVLKLNDGEINLGSLDPKLHEYIITHITKSLKEERARVGRFLNPDSKVQKWSHQIISDHNTNFIDNSKKIARALYNSMEEDNRIIPGDLLVILYKNKGTGALSLSLMKMDYNDTVTRKIREDDDTGKVYIELILAGENFPNLNQKLQKVAFIIDPTLITEEKPAAVLVLDRQQGNEGKIADFFQSDFLATELLLTDEIRTTQLFKSVTSWINASEDPRSVQNRRIESKIRDDISNERNINLYSIANSLFGEDQDIEHDEESSSLKKSFIDHILPKIGDPQFKAVKTGALNKLLEKKSISTSTGIIISAPTGEFDEKVKVTPIGRTEDQEERVNITIEDVILKV